MKRSGILVALAVLAATAGCTSDRAEPSKGPRPVTLVTYSSFVLADDVKADLEDRLDLAITLVQAGDAAEAMNRAILSAGNPEGDVFFGVDTSLLGRALASDAFEPSHPANASAVPADRRVDPTDTFHPVDSGAVCVDYDSTWFEARRMTPPGSFEDLTDAEYRDLLVIENPATSSPGLTFMMGVATSYGDRAADYWRRLADNGVDVAGSWDDAWQQRYTVSGGDRPLVVSYASSPPAEVVFSDGKVQTPATKVVESTCVEQVEFAAVLRGAPHSDAAQALIDAMLAPTWQASLPLSNFVFPIRSDVDLPEVFDRFAGRPTQPIRLEREAVDAGRDEWLADWRSALG